MELFSAPAQQNNPVKMINYFDGKRTPRRGLHRHVSSYLIINDCRRVRDIFTLEDSLGGDTTRERRREECLSST